MPSHAGEITRSYDSLWKEIRTILIVAVRFLLNYIANRMGIVPSGSEFALSKLYIGLNNDYFGVNSAIVSQRFAMCCQRWV
jgi:hypothetical protein